jgi:sensor domain CHASE-containing protein
MPLRHCLPRGIHSMLKPNQQIAFLEVGHTSQFQHFTSPNAAALSARTHLEDHFVERRCVSFGYADDRKATVGRDHVEAALNIFRQRSARST